MHMSVSPIWTVAVILTLTFSTRVTHGTRSMVTQPPPIAAPVESLTCIPAAGTGMKQSYGGAKAPYTGLIEHMRLTWVEGNVKFCSGTGAACQGGIFGPPGTNQLSIFVTRADNTKILFPINNPKKTFGYAATSSNTLYTLTKFTAGDTILTFENYPSASASVQQGEILKFYFGDVLFDGSYQDNSGTACFTVEFYYPSFVSNLNIPQSNLNRYLPSSTSLTCIPVVGWAKGAYGGMRFRFGAYMTKLTLTFEDGSISYCMTSGGRLVCDGGKFGLSRNGLGSLPKGSLALFVRKPDGTIIFPNPMTSAGVAGFYLMPPYLGNENVVNFASATPMTIAPTDVIKFSFGDTTQGVPGNSGTTCFTVTAEQQLPVTKRLSCVTAKGMKSVCSCVNGECKTFNDYQYALPAKSSLRVYLVRTMPKKNLLPFMVSAWMTGNRISVVRVQIRLGADLTTSRDYIDVQMRLLATRVTPKGITSKYSTGGPTTTLVDGQSYDFANGYYVYTNVMGVDELRVFFGAIQKGSLLVQVVGGSVTVLLDDCYVGQVVGMCGTLYGTALSDEQLLSRMAPTYRSLTDAGITFASLDGLEGIGRGSVSTGSDESNEKQVEGWSGARIALVAVTVVVGGVCACAAVWKARVMWLRKGWTVIEQDQI